MWIFVNLLLKARPSRDYFSLEQFKPCYFAGMIRTGLHLFLFTALVFTASTTMYGQEKVHWLTFQEAVQKAPSARKKIMVDVYTSWCGWCKVMDQRTFSDPEVAQYINTHYLPVKFNAETDMDILFRGKTYTLVRQGKRSYHELASELMRGRLSFPTIVFMDEQMNLIQPIPGFQDAEQYMMVLRYFGENYHQRMPWDRYVQHYQGDGLQVPTSQQGRR